MKVEIFVTGIISTNCYVVSNEETKEAVIVDPAAYPKKLKAYLQENELQVKAILLTHGHFDHIMGIDGVLEDYQVPVYVHEEEEELIQDPVLNESNTYTNGYTYCQCGIYQRRTDFRADRIQIPSDPYTGTYKRRSIILCGKRECTVQRRYVIPRFCWTYRLQDKQYVSVGTFYSREIVSSSG